MTKLEPVRRVMRWLFVSRRTSRITVAQWPNVPLGTFIVATALPRVIHLHGHVQSAVRTISVVALMAWGLDEALRGVNPFRRLLGGVVLVLTVVHLLHR